MADWGQQRRDHTTHDKPAWGPHLGRLCVSSLAKTSLWATGPTLVYETRKEITN